MLAHMPQLKLAHGTATARTAANGNTAIPAAPTHHKVAFKAEIRNARRAPAI